MAPVRKTKGVNKRFPYNNEVASNKYGDTANKNKQKVSTEIVMRMDYYLKLFLLFCLQSFLIVMKIEPWFSLLSILFFQ